MRKGARIDAGVAGTLAAQGVSQPLVYRRVRVGIISTGNEVIALDKTLRPGKIYDSNRYMLEAAVMQLGMVPVHLGLIGDDADGIARLIEKGLPDCDVILLTGGVSVGDYDLTPAAIEQAGCEMLIRGASLKPGMACAIGMKDGKLVCGLSGNPASALTNSLCHHAARAEKAGGIQRTHSQGDRNHVGRQLWQKEQAHAPAARQAGSVRRHGTHAASAGAGQRGAVQRHRLRRNGHCAGRQRPGSRRNKTERIPAVKKENAGRAANRTVCRRFHCMPGRD